MESITHLISVQLTKFQSLLEEKYNVQIPSDMWKTRVSASVPTKNTCKFHLKSGPRKGQECGKKTDNDFCSVHAKMTQSQSESKPASSSIKPKAVFHKSAYNNYVCNGFVYSKEKQAVIGFEDVDGKILNLTPEQTIFVRSMGINVHSLDSSVSGEKKELLAEGETVTETHLESPSESPSESDEETHLETRSESPSENIDEEINL